jgi:hypothetical protein
VAASLAAVFFVLAVVFGVRSDGQIVQFLNSPGVVEQFKQARDDKATESDSQSSPLVSQAEKFALYLNPPEPEKPTRPTQIILPRPERSSAKFKLIGTSVHESNPELSMALIDEPGKGLNWVRQGSPVEHLIIEQVKDGLVVVRDGEDTFELEVTGRLERRSLVKGQSAKTGVPAIKTDTRALISPEEQIMSLKKAIAELKAMEAEIKSGGGGPEAGIEQDKGLIRDFISDLEAKAMRISAEEAKKLDNLGKELENADAEPNRIEDRKAKSEASRREQKSPSEK